MKYENSKVKGISKKTLRTLEQIALSASYALELRGGIEARNNDSEDFQDIGVNAIQEMLEQAYLLGRREAEYCREKERLESQRRIRNTRRFTT